MYTFFHGWRRKTGAVTLVMACMLFGMWVRSYTLKDRYGFGSGQERNISTLMTFPGGIVWQRHEFDRETLFRTGWYSDHYGPAEFDVPTVFFPASYEFLWRFHWSGFEFGSAREGRRVYYPGGPEPELDVDDHDPENAKLNRVTFWAIPYWSAVLPLTLLSAYLILVKPRKRLHRDP